MNIIKRIFIFISIFLLYFIVKEFISLYLFARSLHPYAGYAVLGLILAAVIYFVVVPVVKIISIPRYYAPTTNPREVPLVIEKRMAYFRENTYLLESGFDFSGVEATEQGYKQVVARFEPEARRIRKKYVSRLFYTTSISQNGFLDAILILSASVNLVKELFTLYQGRVSNKDLFAIAKRVYYSMAIGGSEGVEYATEEIFSKFSMEGLRGIPFADKIVGSLVDGFVNAAMLTRISLITENYCKLVYLKSPRDLYPSATFIASATRLVISDMLDRIRGEMVRSSFEKTGNLLKSAVYPVTYIFKKALGKSENEENFPGEEILHEIDSIEVNRVSYGFSKLAGIFRKKNLN